jgi:acyl carrier protein
VAYVVPREGAVQATGLEELRPALAAALPETMVPAAIVWLTELPRLPNGKLDRTLLPAPGKVRLRDHVAPGTPVEEILAGIYGETLGVERVGTHDNFFELGGHSLIAARMISRVRDAFRMELPVRKLFEAPTVAQLAAEVERALKTTQGLEVPALERVPRDGSAPLSFAQQRLWFLQQLEPESPAYNILGALRLRGELDRRALDLAMTAIRQRHESLRTVFQVMQGEPAQVIQPACAWESPVVDLAGLPEASWASEVETWIARQSVRPFDLATGPLLRTLLLRLGPHENMLVFGLHHIVSRSPTGAAVSPERPRSSTCRSTAPARSGRPSAAPPATGPCRPSSARRCGS